MEILSQSAYQTWHQIREREANQSIYELWLPALLLGSMGAITWAIRGTAGWGGVDGTVVPGLMWGILWYYLSQQRGIDARGIVFWLGMGIALGGELGYGQYTGWILGKFSYGNNILPISPATGYLWFFLCGIGWAAPGGILLGWALNGNVSIAKWLARTLLLLFLLVVLFAWPIVDWFAARFVDCCPGLLFPNADLGIYAGTLDKHLQRTIYTNTQNFLVVVWWLVALLLAWMQRDRSTVVTGLILGVGFGFGFMQSAMWCLGYGFAPKYIDWWKMWELNSGFNLGVLYAIVLFWVTTQTDKKHTSKGDGFSEAKNENKSRKELWQETLFLAFGGSVLLYFMGFEYFFWTGILLSLFYFITMSLIMIANNHQFNPQIIIARRKNIFFVFSMFLLVFLLFHGGSTQAGIVFGLYSREAADQYAWPLGRIAVFLPFALVLTAVTIYKIQQILKISPNDSQTGRFLLHSTQLTNLMTFTAFIGALSIWPAKIGIFYALFLFLALYAFGKINCIINEKSRKPLKDSSL
ncbi:MAG: hypothetical protein H6696_06925 [Deferribacteres bacterium]|nr:hypothetical protein [candidate division KSB1 bacterium]MCB9501655.1 hypothetical protein [Deferribacteres bacterium]